MLVRVLVSCLSQRSRKRNISQDYCVVLSQKPRKEKVSQGFWFRGIPRRRKKVLVRFMVSLLFKKRRKRNVSQSYNVVALSKAAKEKCQLGFWFRGFPRRRKREMLVRVMMSLLSQKLQKRNFSQAHGVLACPEAAKENVSQGYGIVAFSKVI